PPRQKGRRHYPVRQCRICLEEVEPKFPPTEDTGTLDGLMGAGSKPVYISDTDPELGRLISPCKCSGTAKYVHEGCLQDWRTAGSAGADNPHFFTCPTCKYCYKVDRLSWGRRLQSRYVRMVVTFLIFGISIFLLGFVADPIFQLWQDPVGTLAGTVVGVLEDIEAIAEPVEAPAEDLTWWEHFVKGFLSLGIIGFVKHLFAMTPWQWWNARNSGLLGPTVRRGGGRARAENISWALVVIGALTFIYSIWKGVNSVTKTLLEQAGDRVLDVGGDDDGDIVDDDAQPQDTQEKPASDPRPEKDE
ncbi:hypothetical protein ACRALDRAFT_1060532, partial [Sodiomyces alcalophilus JCM 7366]|uniref:uncharacterized protein n=1 Tax=Sodiomyces alcalophilus JCM 7366 TaxID=591952 RepID=UPI0039B58008